MKTEELLLIGALGLATYYAFSKSHALQEQLERLKSSGSSVSTIIREKVQIVPQYKEIQQKVIEKTRTIERPIEQIKKPIQQSVEQTKQSIQNISQKIPKPKDVKLPDLTKPIKQVQDKLKTPKEQYLEDLKRINQTAQFIRQRLDETIKNPILKGMAIVPTEAFIQTGRFANIVYTNLKYQMKQIPIIGNLFRGW